MNPYSYFLNSITSSQWKNFGIQRRSGVLAPLFSLYSKKSIGIGEYPDLKLLVDWCLECNMSIIQLLPLNDTGFDFAPYSCQSTFAMEAMYIRLSDVEGIKKGDFEKDLNHIKTKSVSKGKRVDYGIKKLKLNVLWKMFESNSVESPKFIKFKLNNKFWLDDYAVYKVLKDKYAQKSWEEWQEKYKFKEANAVLEFSMSNESEINFHKWLQYQIYLQFSKVKEYANSKGVFIQGDLPFLVARDSSDVWSNQNYFNLNVSSGAPPDMYFAKGQRWGMPTYNWERIETAGFDYLKEKVKFAENFYNMFRIDHFVGLFRLWTIRLEEANDTYGLNGFFDPKNEDLWKEHGRKILTAMTDNTNMLPCAEDLGVVPGCSYETLKEFAIPGMDVQRWTRDWGNTYDFKDSENYRENSISIISSHDMSPLMLWWEEEASTVDALLVEKICYENDFDLQQVHYHLFDMTRSTKLRLRWHKDINTPDEALRRLKKSRNDAWMFYDMHMESYDEKAKFWRYIGLGGTACDKATPEFIKAAIQKVSSTRSIFSIQLIQDWLSLGNYFDGWTRQETRVNVPGTMDDKNWSIIMPLSLEDMIKSSVNEVINSINVEAGRI